MNTSNRFESFAEFYPYYLSEHSNRACRILHYIGTTLGFSILIYALAGANYLLLPVGIVCGYAFAWVGHFFFEKNKPATFQYPLWSFIGDWVMLKDLLLGRLGKVHPGLNGKPDV